MGCGVVATYGHAPAIVQTPGLVLTSVYDPDPVQLARFKERFPYTDGYTDLNAFFASEIDAVSVTSPAPVHFDNVREAAKWGKPVLCEKPLAMNDADIETMIDIMESAGLLFATAFCYRFSPVALRIKEMIANRVIGEVRALRMIYIWDLHGKYEYLPNNQRIESPIRVGRMQEGGPMVDCGVHQIDLVHWWTGAEVVRQQASAAWIDQHYEAPDHVWLHLDHENGVHSAIEMSFSYGHTVSESLSHFSYHIIGTDGLIRFDRDGWHFEVRTPQGTQYLPGADEKNFAGMYAEWLQALQTGNLGNMPSAREGLRVTRIARAATEEAIANHRIFTALTTK
jgi:predicted dehydrogenase